MEAIITKVKLCKIQANYYFKIELVDANGNIYLIDNPKNANSENFKKQVIGIMNACDSNDLMFLTSNEPNKKRVIGYYINGLKILENEEHELFEYYYEKKKYLCRRSDEERKLLETLIHDKIGEISKENGEIVSILFADDFFKIYFKNGKLIENYIDSELYLKNSRLNITSLEYDNSKNFESFIVALMNFYKIDDLLKFSGKDDKKIIVDLELDINNKVKSITSIKTGLGLVIDKEFKLLGENIKSPKVMKKKILSK